MAVYIPLINLVQQTHIFGKFIKTNVYFPSKTKLYQNFMGVHTLFSIDKNIVLIFIKRRQNKETVNQYFFVKKLKSFLQLPIEWYLLQSASVVGDLQKMKIKNAFFSTKKFDSILVMAQKAVYKIHCWRLKYLKIFKLGDHGVTKNTGVFDGEMIFTFWQKFNEMMDLEIILQISQSSAILERWCQAPLTNVYFVSEKYVFFSNQRDQILMKVKPELFQLNQLFYFRAKNEHDPEVQSDNQKQDQREKPMTIIQKQREKQQQQQIRKALKLSILNFIEIEEEEEKTIFSSLGNRFGMNDLFNINPQKSSRFQLSEFKFQQGLFCIVKKQFLIQAAQILINLNHHLKIFFLYFFSSSVMTDFRQIAIV